MAQSGLLYCYQQGAVQRRRGDNALRTVEILQYTLRKGSGAAFHAIMQEISVPYTNATGSMLFRLVTLCMTRTAIT